ncbi:MAG: hypothetical protein C4329_04405 [Chitinophagaceae bacterium]
MKILLTQLSSYHLWANNLLLDKIKILPAELQNQLVASSFPSINATLYHLWNAESLHGKFDALSNGWLAQSKQWHEWIVNAQEHMFDHEFIYYNSKKEKFKQRIYEMLVHVFNHGTYHRGQLVNILRQLEVGDIPATDFIVWSRRKGLV